MEAAGGEGSSSSGVVPEQVVKSVETTLASLEQVETQLVQFLSLYGDADLIAELPPLQRAQSLFLLAKATTTLFSLRVRCDGINPDEHPVNTELARLRVYEDKIERLAKEPVRPSATLNYQAATRFIEHSLPDLTTEQRKSMRAISKGEGPRLKYSDRTVQKKRKYQSSETKSVRDAAKEFLEKAAREVLGANSGGLKGPLRLDASDEEDMPID